MNVIMISPGYPAEMAFFTQALAAAGATVIGIGDQSPQAVPHNAHEAMAHYVHVGSLADAAATPYVFRAEAIGLGRVISGDSLFGRLALPREPRPVRRLLAAELVSGE